MTAGCAPEPEGEYRSMRICFPPLKKVDEAMEDWMRCQQAGCTLYCFLTDKTGSALLLPISNENKFGLSTHEGVVLSGLPSSSVKEKGFTFMPMCVSSIHPVLSIRELQSLWNHL